MSMTSIHAFGYNGFNQIAWPGFSNSEGSDSGAKTRLTGDGVGAADSGEIIASMDWTRKVVRTECCITWSQIWFVSDDGRIHICGHNERELSQSLVGTDLRASCIRELGNDIIIFGCNACWVVADGDTKLCKVETSQSQWQHIDATEKCVVAVNDGGVIHEGRLHGNHGNWSLTFTPLETAFKVKSVACGFEHVLVLSDQGAVYSYGAGSRGQLGQGDATVDPVGRPTRIESLDGIPVTSVTAGGWHSVAVTRDGDVYVWGWNESGQLCLPNGKHERTADISLSAETDSQRVNKVYNIEQAGNGTTTKWTVDTGNRENTCDSCDTCVPLITGHYDQNPKRSSDGSAKYIPLLPDECDNSRLCIGGDNYTSLLTGNYENPKISSDGGDNANPLLPGDVCDNLKHGSEGGDNYGSFSTGNRGNYSILDSDGGKNRHGRPAKEPAWGELPVQIHQNVDPLQVQAVPYGLDIPDDLRVQEVACGSRHTCVLFDKGFLMTAGWNNYGQLCHGDRRNRSYLETVAHLVEKNKIVTHITARYWNTIVRTQS